MRVRELRVEVEKKRDRERERTEQEDVSTTTAAPLFHNFYLSFFFSIGSLLSKIRP